MSISSQAIEDKAVEWAVKKDRGLSPEEAAELELWLAADVRHLGAYCKAQAIMARLGRMHGTPLFRSELIEREPQPVWSRRRILMTGSIAASIAAFGLVGTAVWKNYFVETFTTEVGQTREVLLSDGSAITLNTDSQVSVEYGRHWRKIRLLRGEALFDVAKDKTRPFYVVAGDTQVRAVGTSFTVSMLTKQPIEVLVREGVVELNRVNAPSPAPVRAGANTKAIAMQDAPIVTAAIAPSKLERDLAWQHGRIAFERQTLEDAAQEFSRYSEIRIVVDPSIANRTVTGLFASNDPIGFAKTAATLLNLKVTISDRQVNLFDAPENLP
jgi:transmembrane sensor